MNHRIQIGITCAKAPREPVSAALGNPLAIGEHFKLTGLAGRNGGGNTETLLYEGRETRDLGFVVLSSRAGYDLDLHSFSPVCSVGHLDVGGRKRARRRRRLYARDGQQNCEEAIDVPLIDRYPSPKRARSLHRGLQV